MIRVNNEEAGVQLDSGSGIRLVGVETSLVATMGGGGSFVSYVRPSRVEIPGDRAIRVTDHVMIARLSAGALVLIANAWRRIR